MTPEDEYLAKEALRLRTDQVLLKAISDAQTDAMKELVSFDVSDTTGMLRLQSRVQAFDEVLSQLEAMIMRGSKQEEIAVP